MPICTNPACGQITKTMSLYCPSCGQQTLSRVDRSQVENPHSSEISMENFDRITADVPAPKEKINRGSSRHKKRMRSPKKFSLPRFRLASKFRGRRTFWVAASMLALGLFVIIESNPSFFPQEVSSKLSEIKRTVVQVLPNSDAYQLGFNEGNSIRMIEETGRAVSEHFESYGKQFFSGQSIEDQIKNCEVTVTINPEECADAIRKQNSPEYKRQIYQKYAEDIWEPIGLLNFLDNTPKNRSDFISGFMIGLFG